MTTGGGTSLPAPRVPKWGERRRVRREVSRVWQEFRQFLFRGNVVDLAVAVVIGVAFGSVVTALVQDLIMPVVAAIFGQPNFSGLTFTLHHSRFLYGAFIDAVVSFVLVAAGVFWLVVTPMSLMAKRLAKPAVAPATKACPECLSQIPVGARRCAFCTSPQA